MDSLNANGELQIKKVYKRTQLKAPAVYVISQYPSAENYSDLHKTHQEKKSYTNRCQTQSSNTVMMSKTKEEVHLGETLSESQENL